MTQEYLLDHLLSLNLLCPILIIRIRIQACQFKIENS